MKKGFIFTIDAFYAMIFVVSLAGAFAFYYTAAPTNSKEIETLNMQTTDTALAAFYLGKSTADYPDFSGTLATDANYAKCTTLYSYTILYNEPYHDAAVPPLGPTITTQSPITENKFCRRIR